MSLIREERVFRDFPHIQSIEYAEHADQPRAAAQHRKSSKNAAEDMENAEHADCQREKNRQSGKSEKVALSGMASSDMDYLDSQACK